MISDQHTISAAPRDSAAFEVRAALGQPGCPICRLALRAVGRFIDSLAYEQVNDPGMRGELRASHGFCNQHAYRWLNEAHSPLGTAIIYRDVLQSTLRELGRGAAHAHANGSSLGRLRALLALNEDMPAGLCPACQRQREAEGRYVSALLESLRDPVVRESFDSSDGLCLIHTLRALSLGGPGVPAVLRQTKRSVERLIDTLDEVIRKEDYRYRQEPRSEEERSAPSRAVTWAAGLPGVVQW
ncbi:MAG: hypothetical protein IT305_30610 [Chloroflexi bacterium]|nr:hypothetical protein [Chloroflexota bacterium]